MDTEKRQLGLLFVYYLSQSPGVHSLSGFLLDLPLRDYIFLQLSYLVALFSFPFPSNSLPCFWANKRERERAKRKELTELLQCVQHNLTFFWICYWGAECFSRFSSLEIRALPLTADPLLPFLDLGWSSNSCCVPFLSSKEAVPGFFFSLVDQKLTSLHT